MYITIWKNTNYKLNIKLLNPSLNTDNHIQYRLSVGAGNCYVKNFEIPKQILLKSKSKYILNKTNIYDIIFTVQYNNKQCGAFILDGHNAYYWELPSLLINVDGSYLVYSKKHGLISVGNYNNYESFNIYIKIQWTWNKKWST